ncbi:cytochrome P450 [Pyrenochaeta sp. MPI-SDFR-AT-0127]|nr:cytochrome P450 [Pyrenochaeta sp. MPI-SDFR-AT-0127]
MIGLLKILIGGIVASAVLRVLLLAFRAIKLGVPGPLLCKITSFRLKWNEICGTTQRLIYHKVEVKQIVGNREKFIEALHHQYGDVVMIQPTEVSVRSSEGLREVFSAHKLDKPGSEALLEQFGESNLVTTADVNLHARRRKLLSPAYTAPAIASEERQEMFRDLVGRLCGQIDKESEAQNGVCNIWPLLRFLAVDIMTHMVLGSSDALNSLENPSHRHIVRLILRPVEETLSSFPVLLLTWFPQIMRPIMRWRLFPQRYKGFGNEDAGLHAYVKGVTDEYVASGNLTVSSRPTHLELLSSHYGKSGASDVIPGSNYIASDSLDHLFAGSLTSADTLSYMLWEMCLPENRSRQVKLREELHAARLMPGTEINLSEVTNLPYLFNVIRETLRRYPPIPFSQLRQMVVSAQSYSVHRQPDAYPDPERWVPERWEAPTGSPEAREMSRHFWPFGSGQRMCIGMHIAWAEIKLVVANIFSTYEVSFPSEWLDDKGKLLPENERSKLFPVTAFEPIQFRKL